MKNFHDVEGTGKAAESDLQSNEDRVLASGSLQSNLSGCDCDKFTKKKQKKTTKKHKSQ